MEHLRKVIPQYEIKSVELSFEKLQKAIKAGELDFFRQLPAFFYSLPRGSLKTATVA